MRDYNQFRERFLRVLNAKEASFVELVEMAGLDKTKDFRFANLAGADLSNLDLSGFDFSRALIKGCSFKGSRLAKTVFSDEQLDDPALQEALKKASDWPQLTRRRQIQKNSDWSSMDIGQLRQAAERGVAAAMAELGKRLLKGDGAEKDVEQGFYWSRLAAIAGDTVGMGRLGYCYLSGSGVEKDPMQAISWLLQAAEAKDASSLYNLGWCYMNGEGVEADAKQANAWFHKAAEAGDAAAIYVLGLNHQHGVGVEANAEEANDWYRKAAEAGDTKAMVSLGFNCEHGIGVEANAEEANAWYRKAAEAGDTIGMVNLGVNQERGVGVEANAEEANAWYRKAAEAGYAIAMRCLGNNHMRSVGVEANAEEANAWYRRAAEAGDAIAMHFLGLNYERGIGVEANAEEANAWYRTAAEAGDAQAMVNLGLNYERGVGVGANAEEANAWYRKAAEAGDAIAMRFLAVNYERGVGVEANAEEANAWYRRAAEAGDAKAMVNLGLNYERGVGVEANAEEAYVWYRRASEAGDEYAKRRMMILPDKPSPKHGNARVRTLRKKMIGKRPSWPFKPLIAGVWQAETGNVAERAIGEFLRYGSMTDHDELRFLALRSAELSFYPRFRLIEALIAASTFAAPRIASLLVGPDRSVPVIGDSLAIHELNETGALDLSSDEHVIDYLQFFCVAVHGDDGVFRIIETCDSSFFADPFADVEAIQAVLKSPEIIERQAESWTISANVRYATAIFDCRFVVHRDGKVKMEEDKALLLELPLRIETFEGAFRSWRSTSSDADDDAMRERRAMGLLFEDY